MSALGQKRTSHSITLSAATSRDCGTLMPSAQADWAFTISSNLSACIGPLGRARRPHPKAIDRGRGCDVQAAQVVVAKAEVRGIFRHADHPEANCLGREHVDAAGTAAIDVAGAVDLHSIRRASPFALRLRPDSAGCERPVGAHVEDTDVLAVGVVDEEPPLIAREAEPVRLAEIVSEERELVRGRLGPGAGGKGAG